MISNVIQIVKHEKQQIIRFIILALIALFVLFIAWGKIEQSESYRLFNGYYNEFTVKIVKSIGLMNGYEIQVDKSFSILHFGQKSQKLILPVGGYKYFFLGFIFLFLVSIKHLTSSISAVLFVLLFIAFRGALISFLFLMYYGTVHGVLLVWLDPLFFLPAFVLVLHIIHNNKLLKILYAAIESRFTEILNVTLSKLLIMLIVIPPLTRVIFTYLHSEILPGIVNVILQMSKLFIGFTGRTAEVTGRFIYIENNWIDLEYPCIGLGVFTIVAVLILTIKGNYKNKVVYLIAFAFIYLILNALRISVLLLYINSTYNEIGLNKTELHNYATYFMYFIAFAFLAVYILWFNALDFKKNMKMK